MKRRVLTPLLVIICIISVSATLVPPLVRAPENTETSASSDEMRVKYNNDDVFVEIGFGLWGTPMPIDFDGDGLMDLIISCADKPYTGIYFYRNIGTADHPLFDKPVKKHKRGYNNICLSVVDGVDYAIVKGTLYTNFTRDIFKNKSEITYQGDTLAATYERSRSNTWNYVDWDGDGDQDILVGLDDWDDYGWEDTYNEKGEWTNGPIHGYIFLLENVDGEYINRGKVQAAGKDIDVYGWTNPCIADFDGDGDLDIICGDFLEQLTWFENVGTCKKPLLAEGRFVTDDDGNNILPKWQMIKPVPADLNGDGHIDLVICNEDGMVAWLKSTGKLANNMPVFERPVYLYQRADALKFGSLATPYNVDWDDDGIDDLIVGNSAGNIAFFKNLSGGVNPVWAPAQLLSVDGKAIRILAGENGSIQGPCEKHWGYTVLNVVDWDGDGRKDIVINSIWGKIQWFRNIGAPGNPALAPLQDIEVVWEDSTPKPQWNWWNPQSGTLVTQWRTTPVVIDWNGDGLMDLIMLDHEGYLAFYERFTNADGKLTLKPGKRIFYGTNCSEFIHKKGLVNEEPGLLHLNIGYAGQSGRRKICFVDWNGDGRLDLIMDGINARLFENVYDKDGNTYFEYKGDMSDVVLAGHSTCPTPVFWRGDGIPDILLGAEDGHFYLIKNERK